MKNIAHLFGEFNSIGDYRDKVVFFDKHFGILLYALDFFDPELTWFTLPSKTTELIDLFKKEKNPVTNYYERRLKDSSGKEFIFDIRPSHTGKRLILNEYILQKFLGSKETLEKLIDDTLPVENPAAGIKYQLDKSLELIEWVKKDLKDLEPRTIRLQFLNFFFKGYSEFYNNDTLLKIRRKQTELYLFSQGLLYGNYITILKKRYLLYTQNTGNAEEEISLDAKIIALGKLGVIKSLQKKCVLKNPSERNKRVTTLICTLIATEKNACKIESIDCKTIYQYVETDNNRWGLKEDDLQFQKIDLRNFR
jgi:hypothetical protein